jgi:hypothetical protein
VQKISVEICNEGSKISTVTHGGAKMGVDVEIGGKLTEKWVRKFVGTMPTFNPQQEKVTYQNEIKEIIGQDWRASTSSTPHIGDHTKPVKPTEKASALREFLKKWVQLMKDETALNTLYKIIDQCKQDKETLNSQRVVNQVLHLKRTNGESRFNAQIGEYDVNNVILDVGYDWNVLPK